MKEEFCTYLDYSPVLFFKWSASPGWPVLHVSRNVTEFLGYTPEAFIKGEVSYANVIAQEDKERIIDEVKFHLEHLSPSFTHTPYRLIKADGESIWVEDKTFVMRNLYGEVDYLFGYISDITKVKEAEAERLKYLSSIENSNKELIRTINNLHAYKHILDETNIVSMSDLEGNITYANDAFFKTSGFTPEEAIGKPHSILRHPDTPKHVFANMWQTLHRQEIWKGFLKNMRRDGSPFYVNVTIAPLLDENRKTEKYISVRHDISSLVEKSEALKYSAITDPLTGLGNRFKLLIDKDKSDAPCLGIFDIANFNEINDFYGYQIGDALIREFGANLAHLCDESYGVYRMYADQFAILGNKNTHPDFEATLRTWHQTLQHTPLHVGDEAVHISLVGVLTFEPSDLLLTTADITKNYAKINHLDFAIYSKSIELGKEYERNLYWQKQLKLALLEGRIVPYFQPIMNVKTGHIDKYEALVRLISDGDVISPFQFLEIAKKTNQYAQITRVMIEQTLSFFAKSSLKCSINLTLEDIKNKETMAFLWESVARHAMQGKLELEIVESEGIENFKEIEPFIQMAKQCGCMLSIDDFGTGYSNFNYLIKLQAHTIKIDGSIIKELMNPVSGAGDVLEAIVIFAKNRGMKTIAEFVSSKELYEKIVEFGIDYAQGYHIAPPMPKEKVEL